MKGFYYVSKNLNRHFIWSQVLGRVGGLSWFDVGSFGNFPKMFGIGR